MGALLSGFGAQPQNIEPQIAKSLDAAVLRVNLAVQFAEQKKSGGMFRNQSSVESGTRLAYLPELTQVLVVTPGSGKARITLDKLVTIEDPVVTIRDAETKGEKTAEAIGNAITGLMTGITRQTAKLEAVADPAVYEQGVGRYGAALAAPALSGPTPHVRPALPSASPAARSARRSRTLLPMRSTLLPLAATLAIQALVAMATITVPVLAPAASDELHLSAGLIGLYVSLVYLGSIISSAASADLIRRLGAIRFNLMDPHHLEFHDAGASDRPCGGLRGWTRIDAGQRYPPPPASFPSPKASIGWLRAHVACLAEFLTAVAAGRRRP